MSGGSYHYWRRVTDLEDLPAALDRGQVRTTAAAHDAATARRDRPAWVSPYGPPRRRR